MSSGSIWIAMGMAKNKAIQDRICSDWAGGAIVRGERRLGCSLL